MVAQKTSLFNNTKREKPLTGFTILEVILAIFILTVAVFSSYALIEQTVRGASLNRSKLAAYYLAQEGVENIRNQRDNNWLNNRDWDQNISSKTETIGNFTRRTDISWLDDVLEVKINISWAERGRSHQVEVISELQNWFYN